jgi:acetolactate synthase-1/2/3 large subunit
LLFKEKRRKLREAHTVKTATETTVSFLMNFRVEREDNVFPMVPVGVAINEMINGKGS